MNGQDQFSFEPLPIDESSIALHQHHGTIKPTTVIVFVHGLNGNGYRTWAGFPRYLFEGEVPVDVAIFDYFSGTRRRFATRAKVEDIAETLSERLVELGQIGYEDIFVVAHSMGGLIAKSAVRTYLNSHRPPNNSILRIAGIILFGTPLRGSRLAQKALQIAITEARYLRKGATFQDQLEKYFVDTIDSRNGTRSPNRAYRLPVYAGHGEKDWIVHKSSATSGVVTDQIQTFRAGHKSLVKPIAQTSPQIGWVQRVMRETQSNRSITRAELKDALKPPHPILGAGKVPPSHLITEFAVDHTGHHWLELYHRIIDELSYPLVSIIDRNRVPYECTPSLLMTVHDIKRIENRQKETENHIIAAKTMFDTGKVDVRIVGVGHKSSGAEEILEALIQPVIVASNSHRIFAEFVRDDSALSGALQRYIDIVANTLQDSLTYSNEDYSTISLPESSRKSDL